MVKFASAFFASLVVASVGWAAMPKQRPLSFGSTPSCHHTGDVRQEDRDRAAQAVAYAKTVNASEAETKKRIGEYRPVTSLSNLATAPSGFKVNLYADRTGYMFSLKDTLDPCHFAVFSDTAGLIYQQSALTAPIVAN